MAEKKAHTDKRKTSVQNKRAASAQRTKGTGKTSQKSSSLRADSPKDKTQESSTKRSASAAVEISLWVVLGMSVLIFLGNFHLAGMTGEFLSGLFFGLLGFISFPFPVILVVTAFFIASNRTNIKSVRISSGVILLLISLCMLGELIRCGSFQQTPAETYAYSRIYHAGGGLIGSFFAGIMVKAFGLIASYIIAILLMVISVVLITDRSVIKRLSSSQERFREQNEVHKREKELKRQIHNEEARTAASQRLMELDKQRTQAREDADKAQQAWEQQKEASREAMRNSTVVRDTNAPSAKPMRMNRKVEGINFDTATSPVSGTSEDMREVKINIFDASGANGGSESAHVEHVTLTRETAPNPGQSGDGSRKAQPSTSPADQDSMIPAEEMQEISAQTPDISDQVSGAPDRASSVTSGGGSVSSDRSRRTRHGSSTLAMASDADANKNPKEAGEITPDIDSAKHIPREAYRFPPVSLLNNSSPKRSGNTREALTKTARKLENTLANFGVNVAVTDISCGPAVTRYEVQPEVGVKVSRIVNLADDIKLNLAASDIRIEAPIPGKAAVGIEVPNKEKMIVPFRDLMESSEFKKSKSNIAFALGRDIAGRVVISDIAKMPHLLIAGATGSGKSVCINTIIMSILYKAHPDDVKFIMIDPKVVELNVYNGIPHLLIPVVTDPKKAAGALHWAVHEMETRYQKFAEVGARDMDGYNNMIKGGMITKSVNGQMLMVPAQKMPQIVVIVDELADLMMVSSSEVEAYICRLAQLARAAGIHLVIATQRPSVNVITGLIKANMPSRIAFAVTSGVDSRTILDMVGAEKLLGKGDMLYYPQGFPKPVRVQGAFVSDDEVTAVTRFIRDNNSVDSSAQAAIQEQISSDTSDASSAEGASASAADQRDSYFDEAGRLIIGKEKASIGMLQRAFRIGFNRAARIMDQLEEAGVVGPEEGTKPRRVLMSIEQFEDMENGRTT